METLLCVNPHALLCFGRSSTRILVSWSQGGKIQKTLPSCSHVDGESAYFAYRWCHRPTPRPLAFELLSVTASHNNNNMLVLVLQKILSLLEERGQNILLLCHYAEGKTIMDDRLAIFVFFFFFLCLVSPSPPSVVMHLLHRFFSIFGEFQAPPIGVEYDIYSALSRSQWICLDANILEVMPRKTGGETIVVVCVNMTLATHMRAGWINELQAALPTLKLRAHRCS